jgi:hypothetical protein
VESFFNVVSVVLLAASLLVLLALVREALPHLSPEDRTSLQSIGARTFRQFRVRDHALRRAWEVHASTFPNSHKRQLFAALLIATALSVLGYPLWLLLE